MVTHGFTQTIRESLSRLAATDAPAAVPEVASPLAAQQD
jgi:hypothetical protein